MSFHLFCDIKIPWIFLVDFHLQEDHRRTKRNVFLDMIDNFTEDDDDDDGSEEEDEEEEEENISESVETSTSRFGRFMSPLAFSKFSETLGLKFISL